MRKKREVRIKSFNQALDFSRLSGGQSMAELPEALPDAKGPDIALVDDTLGEPLTIGEAARLIGCSSWTVRQQCLRQGLPHWRASRTGRLIFYRNQVVRWLIEKQTERRW